jgi:hypothetical protein
MEMDTQLWLCQELGYIRYEEGVKQSLLEVFVKLNGLIRSKQDKGPRA